VKWLLIVVAITSTDGASVREADLPRTSMAQRLHATFLEWSHTRDAAHGVAFASRRDCRAAQRALDLRAPDTESAPDGAVTYKAFCKLIQGDTSS